MGKLTTLAFIVLSDLKELNEAAPRFITHELDRNPCILWKSAEIFPGWDNVQILLILFQVADDTMQMGVHKTLYPFYPISLCWLHLNSQSFTWNVFYTSSIRNAIIFINCPINCPFFDHFLQKRRNLRIIKVQNNMSGEKTLSQNCVKQWEVELYVDKTIGQLIKLEHHAGLKNWADELRRFAAANTV